MLIDFLIGLFAVNALPHYLFARLNLPILSLFGYSPHANLCYSLFCLAMATGLYGYQYGWGAISEHMMLVGGMTVVIGFYLGWDFINHFLRRESLSDSSTRP